MDHEKRDCGCGLGDGLAESSNRSDLTDLDRHGASTDGCVVDQLKREGGSAGRTTERNDCDHEKRDLSSTAGRRTSSPNGTLPSVSNDGRIGGSDGGRSWSSGGPSIDDLTLTAGDGAHGLTMRSTTSLSLFVDTDRPDPAVSGDVDDISVIVLSGLKTRNIGGRPGEPGLGGGGSSMGIDTVGEDGADGRSKYDGV